MEMREQRNGGGSVCCEEGKGRKESCPFQKTCFFLMDLRQVSRHLRHATSLGKARKNPMEKDIVSG